MVHSVIIKFHQFTSWFQEKYFFLDLLNSLCYRFLELVLEISSNFESDLFLSNLSWSFLAWNLTTKSCFCPDFMDFTNFWDQMPSGAEKFEYPPTYGDWIAALITDEIIVPLNYQELDQKPVTIFFIS